jgi:hypothetical protein
MMHADVETVNAQAALPKDVEGRALALLEGVLGQVHALVQERGSLADFEEMIGDFRANAARLVKSTTSGKAEPADKKEAPMAVPVEPTHKAKNGPEHSQAHAHSSSQAQTHSHHQAQTHTHKK